MREIKEKLKNKLKSSKFLECVFKIVSRIPFNNKIRFSGQNNILRNNGGAIYKTQISVVGNNNKIIIDPMVRINKCRIVIHGNSNVIHIKKMSFMEDVGICIDFNGNEVAIGERTILNKECHISCMEGKKVVIGDDCLFSAGIICRTGDSHSIVNSEGIRLNYSKDIEICNHVWVGMNVSFLKGASVPENSVVAMGAMVTKKFDKSGIVLAGNPAKIVKENINWRSELILESDYYRSGLE